MLALVPLIALVGCVPTPSPAPELFPTEKEEITPSVLTKPKLSGIPLSLNLEANYLPKNYKGDEVIEQLFNKFENFSKKDDYETTKNYISRLQSYTDDTIYAFLVNQIYTTISYDADQEALYVEISSVSYQPDLYTGGSGRNRRTVLISRSYGSSKDYIGSNSFGNYVKVESRLDEDYSLAVNNNLNSEGLIEKKISIKMPSYEARFLENDGVVLKGKY